MLPDKLKDLAQSLSLEEMQQLLDHADDLVCDNAEQAAKLVYREFKRIAARENRLTDGQMFNWEVLKKTDRVRFVRAFVKAQKRLPKIGFRGLPDQHINQLLIMLLVHSGEDLTLKNVVVLLTDVDGLVQRQFPGYLDNPAIASMIVEVMTGKSNLTIIQPAGE